MNPDGHVPVDFVEAHHRMSTYLITKHRFYCLCHTNDRNISDPGVVVTRPIPPFVH